MKRDSPIFTITAEDAPKPKTNLAKSVVEAGRSANHQAKKPSPLPPELPPVDPFPGNILPEPFRPYVMEQAKLLCCPPEYIAVPIMVSLGAVLGNKIGLRPKQHDNWTVYPNVWGAVVGFPSSMKSPASNRAMCFIHGLQQSANESIEDDLREFHAMKGYWENVRKAKEKAAVKATVDGDKPDLGYLYEEVPEEPQARQYAVNNSTLEALHELLSKEKNKNGVLCEQDELTALLAKMKKPGEGEELRSFFLKMWNGDQPETLNRIGRGKICVPRVCGSVFGGIQPGKLEPVVTDALNHSINDDGFIQRFGMIVYPDQIRNWKCIDLPTNPDYEKLARDVFERADKIQENDVPWSFEAEVSISFKQWMESHHAKAIEEEAALQGHLCKYRSLIVQLAFLIHFAEKDTDLVDRASYDKALGWIEYLEKHARRSYGAGDTSTIKTANRILDKLRIGKVELTEGAFTARDIYQKGWSGLTSKNTKLIHAALEMLAEYGWLVGQEIQTGGKPKTTYRPHPSISESES